jgi:hypothetical protein
LSIVIVMILIGSRYRSWRFAGLLGPPYVVDDIRGPLPLPDPAQPTTLTSDRLNQPTSQQTSSPAQR